MQESTSRRILLLIAFAKEYDVGDFIAQSSIDIIDVRYLDAFVETHIFI